MKLGMQVHCRQRMRRRAKEIHGSLDGLRNNRKILRPCRCGGRIFLVHPTFSGEGEACAFAICSTVSIGPLTCSNRGIVNLHVSRRLRKTIRANRVGQRRIEKLDVNPFCRFSHPPFVLATTVIVDAIATNL